MNDREEEAAMAEPILEEKRLEQLVSSCYELPQPIRCSFIKRSYNDHFLVEAADQRYILRCYLDKYYIQNQENILFELSLLDFLGGKGIPVARPIEQRNGDLCGSIETAEGLRSLSLFRFAEGEEFRPQNNAAACRDLGKLIARFHLTSDQFKTSYRRHHLNVETLVDQPVGVFEKLFAERNKGSIDFFMPCVMELKQELHRLPKTTGAYGIIHADLHSGNINYLDNKGFILLDFDHCAYGWRVYDLVVIAETFEDLWIPFLQGYESVHPLSNLEKDCLFFFAKARALWEVADELRVMTSIWQEKLKDADFEEIRNGLKGLM